MSAEETWSAAVAVLVTVVVGMLIWLSIDYRASRDTDATCSPQQGVSIDGETWCRTRDDTLERAEVGQ